MTDWLYPISEGSDHWFEDASGARVDVSFESFRDFVVEGRIKDDEWGLTSNFRNAAKGDRMWVYTGDRGLGIIGVGQILAIGPRPARITEGPDHYATWRIDKERSRLLSRHPFPADRVKQHLPQHKRALMGLDAHAGLVSDLEEWVDLADDRADSLLKPLGLRQVQIVDRRPTRRGRAILRHDPILMPIDTRLRSAGFAVGTPDLGPVLVDLAAIRGKEMVVVEAKTIPARKTGREQARVAYGQVKEYAWRIRATTVGKGRRIHLWVAFERRPDDAVVRFLEDEGLIVSWSDTAGGLHFDRHSTESIKRLIHK